MMIESFGFMSSCYSGDHPFFVGGQCSGLAAFHLYGGICNMLGIRFGDVRGCGLSFQRVWGSRCVCLSIFISQKRAGNQWSLLQTRNWLGTGTNQTWHSWCTSQASHTPG